MENRIALIGIIVEKSESAPEVNRILHEYASYIIGRMGIPYQPNNLCIISVVLNAPQNILSTVSGKLGMIPGISVKTIQTKKQESEPVK